MGEPLDNAHRTVKFKSNGNEERRPQEEKGEGEAWLLGEVDSVDALPSKMTYTFMDFSCTMLSVGSYVFDLAMDVIVTAYFYHLAVSHGIYHYWYFGLSLAFILVPSLTMTGFSLRWYLIDLDNQSLPKVEEEYVAIYSYLLNPGYLAQVPMWRWVLRLAALMLQIAPILRYIDSVRYGLLSRYHAYLATR